MFHQQVAGLHYKNGKNMFDTHTRIVKRKNIEMLSAKSNNNQWLNQVKNLLRKDGFKDCELYVPVTTISAYGCLCKTGSIFLRKLPNFVLGEPPSFWRLTEILLFFEFHKVMVVLECSEDEYFNENSFSFSAKFSDTFDVMWLEEMQFKVPLQSFEYNGESFILPCYSI